MVNKMRHRISNTLNRLTLVHSRQTKMEGEREGARDGSVIVSPPQVIQSGLEVIRVSPNTTSSCCLLFLKGRKGEREREEGGNEGGRGGEDKTERL